MNSTMKALIAGAVAGLVAGVAHAADVEYELRVDGITCPFCLATSERELMAIEGVTRVSSDLEAGIIRVCTDERVVFTDDQLRELFLSKGFTYRSMAKTDGCSIA